VTSAAVAPGGGITSPTKHDLIRFASLISDNAELKLSTSKIMRIVREFHYRLPHGSGSLFFEHLAHEVGMTEKDRAKALQNEDIARALSHFDPTPTIAIRRVMAQRGY
jgi:hypothetical protein